MLSPVDLDNFFIAFFSAAMVILMGASYALFFTLAKLNGRRLFMIAAYLSYTLLAVCVFLLEEALNLEGYWHTIVWLMLIGYLLAPHGMWHLCHGTHVASHEATNAGANAGNNGM
jgi:hypothetical protein